MFTSDTVWSRLTKNESCNFCCGYRCRSSSWWLEEPLRRSYRLTACGWAHAGRCFCMKQPPNSCTDRRTQSWSASTKDLLTTRGRSVPLVSCFVKLLLIFFFGLCVSSRSAVCAARLFVWSPCAKLESNRELFNKCSFSSNAQISRYYQVFRPLSWMIEGSSAAVFWWRSFIFSE